MARLTAETDKMNMKSACEVQVEILNQEKQALVDEIEDFKDQIA